MKLIYQFMLSVVLLFIIEIPVYAQLQTKTQIIHIAVASDFLNTFREIETLFVSNKPYRFIVSSGATNTLYMQIQHGAPYDIFFSADTAHPDLLKHSGLTLPNQSYIYAIGRLVLWAPNQVIKTTGKDYLASANYQHLSIANPKLAPYGLAAMEAIKCFKFESKLESKIIYGENINQTLNFIVTHNVEAGLVGLSQIKHLNRLSQQTNLEDVWIVPDSCYTPIRQELVLLNNAKNKSVAFELLRFIKQENIQHLIEQAGYTIMSKTS